MGTPTIITFKGKGNHGSDRAPIHIYRSHDGDPVTTLRDLYTVIRHAATKAHERATEAPHIAEKCIITPSTLTGLYIGETTTTFGMVAHILNGRDSYAQYLYTVDIDAKTITVTDEDENPVDPFSYLEKLRTECVKSHRGSLEESIEMLGDMGFTVAPNCIEAIR